MVCDTSRQRASRGWGRVDFFRLGCPPSNTTTPWYVARFGGLSRSHSGLIYCSSVSAPVPGFASRSDEVGIAVRIVSYSVTTTTPGTGSSITSMIVSSTGTSTTCLGAFLGAFLAAIFDGRCFLAMGFAFTPDRTLDLGLCLFRRRALCGLLARRLGAGLATFRVFLARRNALLCFGHDCPL